MSLKPSIASMLRLQTPLILDGGLATELERRGADLKTKLWSARLLVDNPDLILTVHQDFLEAGADIIISASYQASFPGFAEAGIDHVTAEHLIRRSVQLACSARDNFWESPAAHGRLRPLVAASIGPYGACLADGSEYHGRYGLARKALMAFHKPRMKVLANTRADLLAIETIPSQLEAEVLLELLEDFPGTEAWLSFSCRDNRHVAHGEKFADCAAMVSSHPQIVAVGVNCTRPEFVTGLLRKAKNVQTPLVAYPNSGENWDAETRNWTGQGSGLDQAGEWQNAGARLIGGCCRVGVNEISGLRKMLLQEYK